METNWRNFASPLLHRVAFLLLLLLMIATTIIAVPRPDSPSSTYQNDGAESPHLVNESLVIQTKELILAGDAEIEFSNHHNSVILVLGVTGSGKTTMTQLISGDNTRMISYETDHDNGIFLIKDERELISEKNVVSKTIFPMLVIDNETNEAMYDCPGFADTRSVPIEIANTYFIKRIVDRYDAVKILLTVSYNAVRPGQSRHQFLLLLDQLLQFVKDPKSFRKSIAMVVTKVNTNQSDAAVIRTVVAFLRSLEEELGDIELNHSRQNVRRILRALLCKEDNKYVNIQFFRQPEEPGRLSDIESVQENRNGIRDMVFRGPCFVYQAKGSSSFGYSLSSNALLAIHSLLHKTKAQVEDMLKELKTTLSERYENFSVSDRSVNRTQTNFLLLQDVLATCNQSNLASAYSEALVKIGFPSPRELFTAVDNRLEFLRFLEETQDDDSLIEKVSTDIITQVHEILASSTVNFASSDLQRILLELPAQLSKNHDLVLEKLESYEEMKEKLLSTTMSFEHLLQKVSTDSNLVSMVHSFEQVLVKEKLSSNGLNSVIDFVKTFDAFPNKLPSSSSSQIQVKEALVEAGEQFQRLLQTQHRYFESIEQVLATSVYAGWNSVDLNHLDASHLTSSETGKKLMRDLRLLQTPLTELQQDEKVQFVQGHVIKTSEIQRLFNVSVPGSCIVLMATTTVRIDKDLKWPGQSVYIFAPYVVVVGEQKISVDGLPGQRFTSAASQCSEGAEGTPGGAGGKIFLSTMELRSSDNFILSANGGNGGAGQQGGSGCSLAKESGEDLNVGLVVLDGYSDISAPYGSKKLACCAGNCGGCTTVLANGKPGDPGLSGKRGGDGGRGGGAGVIQVHFVNATLPSSIQKLTHDGKPGAGGLGGEGGLGGYRGAGAVFERVHGKNPWFHPVQFGQCGEREASRPNSSSEASIYYDFIFEFPSLLSTANNSSTDTINRKMSVADLKYLGRSNNDRERGPTGKVGPAGNVGNSTAYSSDLEDSQVYRPEEAQQKYIEFLECFEKNLFLRNRIKQYLTVLIPE